MVSNKSEELSRFSHLRYLEDLEEAVFKKNAGQTRGPTKNQKWQQKKTECPQKKPECQKIKLSAINRKKYQQKAMFLLADKHFQILSWHLIFSYKIDAAQCSPKHSARLHLTSH